MWSSCPTTTSSNAIWVLVYDGTSAADSQPKLIGKLGNHDYVKSMQIAFQGQAVTLFGSSLGPNDPRCCPSQMLRLTYRWDGGKFVVRWLKRRSGERASGGEALGPGLSMAVPDCLSGRRTSDPDVCGMDQSCVRLGPELGRGGATDLWIRPMRFTL